MTEKYPKSTGRLFSGSFDQNKHSSLTFDGPTSIYVVAKKMPPETYHAWSLSFYMYRVKSSGWTFDPPIKGFQTRGEAIAFAAALNLI